MKTSDEGATESESAEDRLDQLLQRCEALDEDVAKLLRKCQAASPRAMLHALHGTASITFIQLSVIQFSTNDAALAGTPLPCLTKMS